MTAPSFSIRLLLVGLLVALAGTFALTAYARDGGRHGDHHGGPGMMFMGRGLDRMLDAVDATPEQRTQIRQIAQGAAADLRAQREAARGLRERSMQLFTQPTVDANAAEQLRQQMLGQHDQASRRVMQAMLDVSRVLSPEQRAKLAERFKQRREMMQRHMRERESIEGQRPQR
jgi:Spy/CpxP family protein refolding chaperone